MQQEEQTFSVTVELPDKPGQLLSVLKPIAEHNGNLLSIIHERGDVTPRGTLPVQIDFTCYRNNYFNIVNEIEKKGINIQQSELEAYDENFSIIVFGSNLEPKFSSYLSEIRKSCEKSNFSFNIVQSSLKSADNRHTNSSIRLEIETDSGEAEDIKNIIRNITKENGFQLVEPLNPG